MICKLNILTILQNSFALRVKHFFVFQVDNDGSLVVQNDISFIIQIYFATPPASPATQLFNYGDPAAGFSVRLNGDSLEFYVAGTASLTTTLTAEAWHYIVFTYASATTTTQLYIDMTMAAEDTAQVLTLDTVTTGAVYIGGYDNQEGLPVSISCLRIFNRVISMEEINQYKHCDTGNINSSNAKDEILWLIRKYYACWYPGPLSH